MLVKNEADIVASVLKDAEKWADKIFILDNGSTDGTWEIINSLKDDVITPWKQDFGAYHYGLRADVYNEFKDLAQPGDCWCFKLDADEFYYDNHRELLYKLQKKDGLVAKKSLDYYLCEEDCTSYNFTGNFEKDRTFIKHVRNSCWAEPRFFKETGNIKWESKPENHYPSNCGRLSRQYIMVKHYQFRSPQQMQKRLDVHNASEAKKQGLAFRHVKETNWQELLKPRSELVFDDGKRETYESLVIRNKINKTIKEKIMNKLKTTLLKITRGAGLSYSIISIFNTAPSRNYFQEVAA